MSRKKPRREGSGCVKVEETDTEEIAMETKPVCVNLNFSKRIIGQLLDRIFRDLISIIDGAVKRKKRRRKQ